jgi:hypothetical protein
MLKMFGQDQIESLKIHEKAIAKLDLGIFINMFLIPGFFFSYLVALCRNLDGA